MADRIVVMNDGRIQQVGDPLTISTRPANVARRRVHGRQQHRSGHGRGKRRRPPDDRRRARSGRVSGRRRAERPTRPPATVRAMRAAVDERRRGRRGGGRRQPGARRDRLRRVPRRPREAPPRRRRRARCSRRSRATATRSSAASEGTTVRISWKEEDVQLLELLTIGAMPAPRRRRDRGGRGARRQGAGAAAGGGARRGRRRSPQGLGDARPGPLPGTLWLLFFLVAPVVMIVLVSFWTQTRRGFDEDLDARQLPAALRHLRLLEPAPAELLQLGDRRRCVPRARLPDRVLPRGQREEPAQPDRALHHRAGAVLDELPHPRRRLGTR